MRLILISIPYTHQKSDEYLDSDTVLDSDIDYPFSI
jgi:hypothetical protein